MNVIFRVALPAMCVLLVLFMYKSCDMNDWNIGDTVCLKANGRQGTVTWFQYGNAARPTLYRVQSVNRLNQVYDAEILETDLEECKSHIHEKEEVEGIQ